MARAGAGVAYGATATQPPWEWRAGEKDRRYVQAAADIATTTPFYVAKAFKRLG